jgi:hypothetical protein
VIDRLQARLINGAVIATATIGVWLFWSEYGYLSTLSWSYENTYRLRALAATTKPDYDLATLPWHTVRPRVFQITQGTLTLATDADPFAYQAQATVGTDGAVSVFLQVDADIVSGGVTVGLQQGGRWIATSSSQQVGAFSDSIIARLGRGKSVTVVIANNNPVGESRVGVGSLRLFFRR